MLSDNIRDDTTPHIKSARINYSYTETHGTEPYDKYRKYLDHNDESVDNKRNPRNLFHDLNSTDAHWFNLARRYLSRGR